MPTIPQAKRPVWQGERKPFDRMKEKNQSFYNGTAWRRLSKAYKMKHPLCVNHKTCKGTVYIVDHVKPINEGGAMYDEGNLQSLCKQCNAKKTGKQAYTRRRDVDPTGGG